MGKIAAVMLLSYMVFIWESGKVLSEKQVAACTCVLLAPDLS